MKNKNGFFKKLEHYKKWGGKIHPRGIAKLAFIGTTSIKKEHAFLFSEDSNIAISLIDGVITAQFRFENLDNFWPTIKTIKNILENNLIYKFGDVVNSVNFFVTRKDKNTLLLDTLSKNLSVWFKREGYDFYVSFKESTSGLLDLEEIITTGCKKLIEQEV